MRSSRARARTASTSRSPVSHAGCIEEFSGRHREVARAAERFRAKHGRAPERGELRNLALENRRAKELSTRGDLQRVWSQTGGRHGFGADQAVHLVNFSAPSPREQPLEDRIEARLTEHTAMFDAGLLRAVALEQSAGELSPQDAIDAARGDGRRAASADAGGRADDDARDPRTGAGHRAPRRRARRARRTRRRRASEIQREPGSSRSASPHHSPPSSSTRSRR